MIQHVCKGPSSGVAPFWQGSSPVHVSCRDFPEGLKLTPNNHYFRRFSPLLNCWIDHLNLCHLLDLNWTAPPNLPTTNANHQSSQIRGCLINTLTIFKSSPNQKPQLRGTFQKSQCLTSNQRRDSQRTRHVSKGPDLELSRLPNMLCIQLSIKFKPTIGCVFLYTNRTRFILLVFLLVSLYSHSTRGILKKRHTRPQRPSNPSAATTKPIDPLFLQQRGGGHGLARAAQVHLAKRMRYASFGRQSDPWRFGLGLCFFSCRG